MRPRGLGRLLKNVDQLGPGRDAMEPRLSLVTLGVADVALARRFYEELGFKASSASQESVAFLTGGSVVLSLYGRAALAEDAQVENSATGFGGITLAHNVRSEPEVAMVLARAVAAGAALVKPAQKVVWGGTSGYFKDLDGHLWEVAHNPFFPIDSDGRLQLP